MTPRPSPESLIALIRRVDPEARIGSRSAQFRCPSCGKRRRAFVYLDSPRGAWTCNRREKCGSSGELVERGATIAVKPTAPRSESARIDLTDALRGGLGRLGESGWSYVRERLPGADLDSLRRLFVHPAALPDRLLPRVVRAERESYAFAQLLFSAKDPRRVIAAQLRHVGEAERSRRLQTTVGGFGGEVVTFNRLDLALDAADDCGGLVVAEGNFDVLSVLASGWRAVVGVPGVGQAVSLARHLREIGWSGRLLLSLDGDGAGAEGVARVVAELADDSAEEGDIAVFNARPATGDLNDVWMAGGRESVLALFSAARPVSRRELADELRSLVQGASEGRKAALGRLVSALEATDAAVRTAARAKPWKRLQAAIANRRRVAPVTAAIRLVLRARSEDPIAFQACVIALTKALDEAADRRAARDNVLRMIGEACVDPIEAEAARAIAERTLDQVGARRSSLAERIRELRRLYSKGVADQEAKHTRLEFRTELRRDVGLRLLRDVGYQGTLAVIRALGQVAGVGPEHLARRWELTSAHYPEDTREWLGDELGRDLDLERLSREQAPAVRAALAADWHRERERSIQRTHQDLLEARQRSLAEALATPEGELFGDSGSAAEIVARPEPTREQAKAIVEARGGARNAKPPTRRQAQRAVLDRLQERRRYLEEMLLCPLFERRYREPDGSELRVQQRCNRALCTWCRGGTFARATEILRTAPERRAAVWELEREEAEVAVGSGDDQRTLSLRVDALLASDSYVTTFLSAEEDSPDAVRARWSEALAVMKRHRERHGILRADWRGVCLFVPELADRPAGALLVAEDDEGGVARGLLELTGESVVSSSRDEVLSLLFEGEAARTFRIKAALLERDSGIFVDPWAKPGLKLSRALGDQLGLGWVGFDRFRKLLNGWSGVPELPQGPDVLLMWVHAPTGTIIKSGPASSFPISYKLRDLLKDYHRRVATRRARQASSWSSPPQTGPPRSPP